MAKFGILFQLIWGLLGDDIGDDVGEIRFIGGDVATSQNCFISLILNSIFSSMLSVDLTISDDALWPETWKKRIISVQKWLF